MSNNDWLDPSFLLLGIGWAFYPRPFNWLFCLGTSDWLLLAGGWEQGGGGIVHHGLVDLSTWRLLLREGARPIFSLSRLPTRTLFLQLARTNG